MTANARSASVQSHLDSLTKRVSNLEKVIARIDKLTAPIGDSGTHQRQIDLQGVLANPSMKEEWEQSPRTINGSCSATCDAPCSEGQMKELEAQMEQLDSRNKEFRALSLGLLSRINDDCLPHIDEKLAQLEEKHSNLEKLLSEFDPRLRDQITAVNTNSVHKDAYSVKQGFFTNEASSSAQVGMFAVVSTQKADDKDSDPRGHAKTLLQTWMQTLGDTGETTKK